MAENWINYTPGQGWGELPVGAFGVGSILSMPMIQQYALANGFKADDAQLPNLSGADAPDPFLDPLGFDAYVNRQTLLADPIFDRWLTDQGLSARFSRTGAGGKKFDDVAQLVNAAGDVVANDAHTYGKTDRAATAAAVLATLGGVGLSMGLGGAGAGAGGAAGGGGAGAAGSTLGAGASGAAGAGAGAMEGTLLDLLGAEGMGSLGFGSSAAGALGGVGQAIGSVSGAIGSAANLVGGGQNLAGIVGGLLGATQGGRVKPRQPKAAQIHGSIRTCTGTTAFCPSFSSSSTPPRAAPMPISRRARTCCATSTPRPRIPRATRTCAAQARGCWAEALQGTHSPWQVPRSSGVIHPPCSNRRKTHSWACSPRHKLCRNADC
jgi:hypothetical protein